MLPGLSTVRNVRVRFRSAFLRTVFCWQGADAVRYEHEIAVRTDALNPPHQYVPWILIDGKHDEASQQAAQDSLLKFVCSKFTGPEKSKDCPPPSPPQLGSGTARHTVKQL